MEKTVAMKLQIKADDALLLVGASPAERALLDPLPDGVTVTDDLDATHDVAVLFAADRAMLEAVLDAALPHLGATRTRWIAYPKGNAVDINRNSIWALVQERGWRLNFNVSISTTWSALRCVPA